MTLKPLLDRLAQCGRDAACRAERLRADIDVLPFRLRQTEQEVEQLQVTYKTVLALADGLAEKPDERPELPENPAHQHILTVFADCGQSLRARDLCEALNLGFEPKRIEGVRAKLKRLVGRGILAETEPGSFSQPRP
ncbi:hypothetical protein [Streptomyces sp. NPDC001070]